MKGIVLQMEGVQDCNTPSYINVDLYRNRELQTAHPRRSHPAQTLWRYLRCPTNHIAKRLRATRRSGFLFSPEGEKTEMRGGAFLNGKEGRIGFRTNIMT